MKNLLTVAALLAAVAAVAAVDDGAADVWPTNLWPLPQQFTSGGAFSELASKQHFVFATASGSEILQSALERYERIIFDTTEAATKYVCIANATTDGRLTGLNVVVEADSEVLTAETDESYELVVPVEGNAELRAATVFGALRGLETFSQLFACSHSHSHPVVAGTPWSISDHPRFQWRGVLIDTSRHFLSLDTIRRTIDGLEASKMNVLHWHIVDSQSFPFASRSSPHLTINHARKEIYTPEDVAGIIDYARLRGVRVIPEFDVPGHTYAWGINTPGLTVCGALEPWGTYCAEPPCGQLDPTIEGTYEVLTNLFTEVAELFPDEYVHTGADEVNYNCWNSSTGLRQRMAGLGVSTYRDLLQHFETKLEAIVKDNGKKMMVWQEILDENIDVDVANTIIQVWKDSRSIAAAVKKGYKVVVSSAEDWYLDCGMGSFISGGNSWCDPFKTWEHMHSAEPVPVNVNEDGEGQIIGGEACLWSELADSSNYDQRMWPRAAAVGERLWSNKDLRMEHPDGPSSQGQMEITRRMLIHRERLVARGVNASPIQPTYCLQSKYGCQWGANAATSAQYEEY